MGSTSSKTSIINQTNQIVADVFTDITMSCASINKSEQTIEIDCQPETWGDTVYENNRVCTQALTAEYERRMDQYNFLLAQWKNGNLAPGEGLKPISEDFMEIQRSFTNIMIGSCKACVISDISQTANITNITTCQALNNIENSITQKLSDKVTQKLRNNQDVLGSLASIIGGSTDESTITNVTNRIQTRLTQRVISGIRNNIANSQNVTVKYGATTGVDQRSTYNSTVSYLEQNQIMNTIMTDAEFDTFQKLYNDQNTLDTLGKAVVNSASIFTKLISSVAGTVTFAVVGITAFLLVILIIVFVVQKIRKRYSR